MIGWTYRFGALESAIAIEVAHAIERQESCSAARAGQGYARRCGNIVRRAIKDNHGPSSADVPGHVDPSINALWVLVYSTGQSLRYVIGPGRLLPSVQCRRTCWLQRRWSEVAPFSVRLPCDLPTRGRDAEISVS